MHTQASHATSVGSVHDQRHPDVGIAPAALNEPQDHCAHYLRKVAGGHLVRMAAVEASIRYGDCTHLRQGQRHRGALTPRTIGRRRYRRAAHVGPSSPATRATVRMRVRGQGQPTRSRRRCASGSLLTCRDNPDRVTKSRGLACLRSSSDGRARSGSRPCTEHCTTRPSRGDRASPAPARCFRSPARYWCRQRRNTDSACHRRRRSSSRRGT